MDHQNRVVRAIESNLNIVESCGMGRLFDVVAALLNICNYAEYDGEGPMKLEDLISGESKATYPYSLDNEVFTISDIIRRIVKDLREHVSLNEISARFHNTIVSIIIDGIIRISAQTGLHKVVLSGGSFQNRYITNHLIKQLEEKKFKVYINRKVPGNDGGLALGQMAIAMKRLSLKN
jgi:hydrogenase maturation protein HypF